MTVPAEDRTRALRAQLLIGDEWLAQGSGGIFEHINPATGKAQKALPLAGRKEVDRAVAAARAAFPAWRRTAPEQRRRLLTRIAEGMRAHAEDFAVIGRLECGMPRAEILPEMGADWFEHSASWADKLHGGVIPMGAEIFDYTLAEPYGVVGVILTWNGPIVSLGMCVAPALAAGCCVLLKPSELAPFSSTFFGQICQEAGLPAGVVNVLPGTAEAGDALVRHPGIDKISFTGGIATARRISAACAESLKPLVLELGGKSANIVFDDADLDRAASAAMSILALSGQGCTLPSRLLLQDGIYDAMVARVSAGFRHVVVGDPFDPKSMMGPVINDAACQRILGMIDRAKRERSGELLVGGERLGGELADGYFIAPTVFGDVDNATPLAQEEVFGPVLSIIRFRDEDEAIRLANDTQYGLAAYVHTRDVSRALRVVAELDAGNVGVNGGGAPAGPAAPFGGVKQSGYGREGGLAGVLEFVRTKNVQIRLA